ncbi:hypothetical protein OQH60_06825 [Campylobacter sp. MIT 21-1685]|uniref:hypothetical protein n=1 Tax=unclassified Campylobacter TaxID=2593542 RepID=UPI00224B9DA8|nr:MULTISPECIES: hypothetical protein [unclassified Campylobacter]MCX2683603.1 hypothetical protein [Campylobacter sp. MIT 21-1684]MCX2751886.1 hypothetical protein [Campylobacter sp. MIT 21-1682]MCX2808061.1 hypothetical protein [Campylobacter sp. MIT 21-1685]
MQKSLFMKGIFKKASQLRSDNFSLVQSYKILKKEYRACLSTKEKFFQIVTFFVLFLTLFLGIYAYYIVLSMEAEAYVFTNISYEYFFFFVFFLLLSLFLLFCLRGRIWDFVVLKHLLYKAYEENSLKIYCKYFFIILFAFIVLSFILLTLLAYEFSSNTNTSFTFTFASLLMEIFD